jgi:hypothetical protein
LLKKLDIGGTVGLILPIEPKIDVLVPAVDWDDGGWLVEVL